MSITLRCTQIYEPDQEEAFLALERSFAQLERLRPDLPQGRRFRVVSGGLPLHTLIWECDFADAASGLAAFARYGGDPDHVALADRQRPFLRQSTLEILEHFHESSP